MSLSSELEVLVQLHAAGNLTDAEFESAKAKLLAPSTSTPKLSTSIPSVQKNIRTKKDDNNPHPMRVVVSSMLILAAAAGLIFATMVPYKYNRLDEFKGNCSGPIFEMFQRGDYNADYDPNYTTPSNPGKYQDFFDSLITIEYYDNYCIEPGKPRLITSLAVLIVSLALLGYLWRDEISDAISKYQTKKKTY
jgi:hypothetical protein